LYVAIDSPTGIPAWKALLEPADAIYSFGPYGRSVLERSCEVKVSGEISHGVDRELFHLPTARERHESRKNIFRLDENTFLFGYVGRNFGRKRVDQLLVAFSHFVLGRYVICRKCGGITPFLFVEKECGWIAPSTCGRCRHTKVTAGWKRDDVRLHLHTPWEDHGPDLGTLAVHLGIRDYLLVNKTLKLGLGASDNFLRSVYWAMDCYVSFGAEGFGLPILEAAACGVPSITPNAGGSPDFCASSSLLIPPVEWIGEDRPRAEVVDGRVQGRSPAFRPILDTGYAIQSMGRMVDDSRLRERLSREALRTAAKLDWSLIANKWTEVLDPLLACRDKNLRLPAI